MDSSYSNLSTRRSFIETISYFAMFDDIEFHNDIQFLPYHMLQYLTRIAHTRFSTNELLRLARTHIVVSDLFEAFIVMVKRVMQTQKIKQELFQRTIPGYTPPTIRQKLTERLGFDVSHISVRGLQMMDRLFAIYSQVDIVYDEYFDTVSDDDIMYTYDIMATTMSRTCGFKEELVAKVYHPDRMDKWVNYV